MNMSDNTRQTAQDAIPAPQDTGPRTAPVGADSALHGADDMPDDLPASLHVPTSPLEYRIPIRADSPEQFQQLRQFGEWMQAAGLPRSDGTLIGRVAVEAARKPPMTDVALRVATNALHQNLRKAWGDQYSEKLADVRATINRVDKAHNGKLVEWLDNHPEVLTNPLVVRTLARLGDWRKFKRPSARR